MRELRSPAAGEPLRICLVTREYPALGAHGGIGTYTRNLAAGLAARGHDVTVVARAEASPNGRVEPFMEAGVHVEPVAAAERLRLPAGNRYVGMALRTLPFARAAAARFRALDRAAPFDVVEVPEYQGWGLGVARAARCPVVVRLHTHTALVRRLNDARPDLDASCCWMLEAATIARGDLVLANSRALAAIAAADFRDVLTPDRLGVLPLGVDADRFAPGDEGWLRAELGLAPGTPLVLYVGRLERRKGVETLVEAFGRVHDRHPGAVLALAGFSTDTGPEGRSLLAVLRERAAALGAADRVRFLGHVPYDQLPRYYAGCDLFVAPSAFEPFGMIYLEAMACGRVAIGCDAGGVPEIITRGRTGQLVPPGDAGRLARTIDELLANPAGRRRMGEAARAEVLARFALPAVGAATEARYRAAIAGRAHGRRALPEDLAVAQP